MLFPAQKRRNQIKFAGCGNKGNNYPKLGRSVKSPFDKLWVTLNIKNPSRKKRDGELTYKLKV
jgi:hypothetical protein